MDTSHIQIYTWIQRHTKTHLDTCKDSHSHNHSHRNRHDHTRMTRPHMISHLPLPCKLGLSSYACCNSEAGEQPLVCLGHCKERKLHFPCDSACCFLWILALWPLPCLRTGSLLTSVVKGENCQAVPRAEHSLASWNRAEEGMLQDLWGSLHLGRMLLNEGSGETGRGL